jgi:hypothetical protein
VHLNLWLSVYMFQSSLKADNLIRTGKSLSVVDKKLYYTC